MSISINLLITFLFIKKSFWFIKKKNVKTVKNVRLKTQRSKNSLLYESSSDFCSSTYKWLRLFICLFKRDKVQLHSHHSKQTVQSKTNNIYTFTSYIQLLRSASFRILFFSFFLCFFVFSHLGTMLEISVLHFYMFSLLDFVL